MADPVLDLADDFATARGVPDDVEWARTAAARLLLEGVRPALARRGLAAAREQVAETGESPGELFGHPLEWVSEQREAWRAEEEPLTEPPRATPVRELALVSLVGAAWIAVLILVVALVQREWRQPYTWPLILAPLLLATAGQVLRGVYERVGRARSQRAAVVATGLGLVVLAVGIAGFFLGTQDAVVVEASTLWLLASAAVHAALAVLLARLWPAPQRRDVTAAPASSSDVAWFAELGATLRQRGDMTDRRVEQILAETRGHAADAGTPVAAEFGPAAEYAARFPADEPVAARRRAWFFSALSLAPAALLVGYTLEEGWRWGSPHLSALLWLLLAGGAAVAGWRRVLRSR
ncbi:hypothetical protein SAMN05216184_101603 [Georgenia satyanarayanai]|uniref:Uncharacterized protein n=1 Tax=Georgenia satyanarayanai TaxID=860221 RepID=A0A2Y8ZXY0_9MICO|nr:hypothetical protein [Georgenia satyanarayanai]PYG02133.1 hypothetical protein A8987_101603 [Georgenia satyanarayanai]SSA36944.1 hypothetical protein SAMN05216184_101603 [Georgenia satyanarayanai]